VNADDLLNFIELETFVHSWEELGLEDDDLAALQIELMANPRRGPLVRETGGLRKLRFSPQRWKQGKSGGLRIGYVYFEKYGLIVLILAYKKGEMDNISAADRKRLRGLIGRIETQLEKQYGF